MSEDAERILDDVLEEAREEVNRLELPRIHVKRSPEFMLPVGDVILYHVYQAVDDRRPKYTDKPTEGYMHNAVSLLWWVPEEKLPELKEVCGIWLKNGFMLNIGAPGGGTDLTPHVITDTYQQRGIGECNSPNCRGVGAYIGSRLVWLTIEDTEKAYKILSKKTDVPVAIVCDLERYVDDVRYREVFDIANEYFIDYCATGKPVNLNPTDNDNEY